MPKVLIVEDDPAVRNVVEYVLARKGMETAASGEAATELLYSDARFSLGILDVIRHPERRLEFPGLTIDLIRREVLASAKPVELTSREFEVLALLASHPGRVYHREHIMAHLWRGDFYGEARAADVHVQHIRRKIEPDPKNPHFIETVRGAGYKFAQL